MRQRIMIAIAMACGPTLLLADEPTTALDVTVQAQILDLLGEQRRDRNMSLLLVTHDLGVVAGHTDEIAVMYGGKLVEMAPTRELFANMKMPYTEALLQSIPKLDDRSHTRLNASPAAHRIWSTRRSAAGSRRAARTSRATLPRRGAAADPDRRGSAAHLRVLVPGRLSRVPREAEPTSAARPTRSRGGVPDGRHRQGAPARPTATCCCASRTSSSSSPSGAPG